jgi:hypothetical protein
MGVPRAVTVAALVSLTAGIALLALNPSLQNIR